VRDMKQSTNSALFFYIGEEANGTNVFQDVSNKLHITLSLFYMYIIYNTNI